MQFLTRVGDTDALLGCHVLERFHPTFTIVALKTTERVRERNILLIQFLLEKQ